jgi:hypothetical protein
MLKMQEHGLWLATKKDEESHHWDGECAAYDESNEHIATHEGEVSRK